MSTLVFGAITFFAGLAGSTPVSADHYRDINRLARRIDSTATSISREMRHFIHSPYHRFMVRDTQQLQQLACHIREVARAGCDLLHLQQDVMALGYAYRALESRFYYIEQIAPSCQNTRRMRRLLNSVQGDIQQMLVCLNHLLVPVCPHSIGAPTYAVPFQPGFNHGHNHFGMGGGQGGYNGGFGYGNGLGHHGNVVRQPNIGHIQHQAQMRSAELDRQLRDQRLQNNGQPRSVTVGNGRLTFNF
jgi:hypothetical protein